MLPHRIHSQFVKWCWYESKCLPIDLYPVIDELVNNGNNLRHELTRSANGFFKATCRDARLAIQE